MPTTAYFGYTYVTPFDPAYVDLWGPVYNTLHTSWDAVAGRLQYPFQIQSPQDSEYRLITNTRWPLTVDQITLQTDAGTLTANLKIESTSVTSLNAIAVTSTESSTSATGANTMSVGQNLSITLSSTSGAGWLYGNLWADRTAAGTA